TSVWLPVKDIWNDEPDEGIIMQIITPQNLTGIGNGKLISKTHEKDKNIFVWEVKNPINTYSIVPNIGNYVQIKDTFKGEKEALSLEYWVLSEHVELAKKQFTQVKPMLEAFEYWFGPYPFYEDGFKMVEAPFLGMEHQSNIAYGNGYQNGYLGSDLSGTGIGLKWDFILVHESGHEWFGNSITAKDQADMWIHEAFTSYSETLFTEHYLDKISAEKYLQGTRQNILNDRPIIGKYGVRKAGSTDMYFKGASMLHTIRRIMDNDEKFRQMLGKMNQEYYHKTVTSIEIEKFISQFSGFDFSGVFEQYLRTTKIPVLEYSQKGNILEFRYSQVVKNLNLPLKINGTQLIKPSETWQSVTLESSKEVKFDPNYYVHYLKVNR
nr:M1 family peptidase [Chryseobacterium sp.]